MWDNPAKSIAPKYNINIILKYILSSFILSNRLYNTVSITAKSKKIAAIIKYIITLAGTPPSVKLGWLIISLKSNGELIVELNELSIIKKPLPPWLAKNINPNPFTLSATTIPLMKKINPNV